MIIEHKKYDLFGEMVFEKAIVEPPFRKDNPMPNEACFLYIIEGTNISISELERMEVAAKESVLLKCGNYIAKMLADASSKKYQAVAVHFHPHVLKKIYENELPKFLQSGINKSRTNMVRIKSTKLLGKYIESILFYFENPELVSEELLILKLKELILLLNQTEDAPAIKQILANLFSPTTYTIQEIINAHLYSNLIIEDLAQLSNHSVSSFKRAFAKIFNESPAKYLKTKKLERAAELLVVSDQRINDIAFQCGFNDLAHFSKSFRQHFNQTPSNYKLNQKHKSLN